MRLISTPVFFMALMISSNLWAGSVVDYETLNCGDNEIEIGMKMNEIKSGCGPNWEPAFISKHDRPALRKDNADGKKMDHFEKWIYRAAGKADTHVLLKNGEVIRIFSNSQN